MPQKTKRNTSGRKEKHGFWYHIRMALNYLSVGIYYAIKYVLLAIWWVLRWIFHFTVGVVKHVRESRVGHGAIRTGKGGEPARLQVIETEKGSFRSFWKKLSQSDSLIGIVLGARGSGKSAIALAIVENLHHESKRKVFAMGFKTSELPSWIKTVEGIDKVENDAWVVIDEGGILFSSRESMSGANKLLSELLLVARHKNLSIIFISQNSANLEINTLRQADFLILKRSSLLQKDFERKIVAEIYGRYQEGFERHKRVKGLALIYADSFTGFIENSLPSFWSQKISKSFK